MCQILFSVFVAVVMLLGSSSRVSGQTPIRFARRPSDQILGGLKSTAQPSEETEPLLIQATKLAEKGELDSADSMVRQYLAQNKASASGHFLLGFILFKAHKPDDSLSEYTKGAKFRDPSAFDLKIVALDYILLGDYADADSWLTKSLSWDTKDSEGWYYLGRIKYNENRWEEASRAFQRCLELDGKNVKAEDNLGLSYEALGRTEEAFASYRRAIAWQAQALNPISAPMIELGRLLLEHDKPEEAIIYLRQAVRISPQESRAHEQLGKAYSRLNELEEATQELEGAVALSPKSSSLHFMLGQVYRKRGMIEKAKLELEQGAALRETQSPPASKSLD